MSTEVVSKVFAYNGSNVTFARKDNLTMINATQMAKSFGKLPADWLKTSQTKDFIATYSDMKKIISADLLRVMRDIRELSCSEVFRLGNFADTSYLDRQGKRQPMYNLTRDGFTSVDFTELKDALSVTAENSAVLSDGRNLQRNLFQRL